MLRGVTRECLIRYLVSELLAPEFFKKTFVPSEQYMTQVGEKNSFLGYERKNHLLLAPF